MAEITDAELAFLDRVLDRSTITFKSRQKMPSLVSSVETLGGLLIHGKFEFPHVQRDYAWKADNQNKLLADFLEHFDEAGAGDDRPREKLIGTMILHELKPSCYHVYDGQQRLTTLMLIIAAARDLLEGESDDLDRYLFKRNFGQPSEIVPTVKPRYTGGVAFMQALIDGQGMAYANSPSSKAQTDKALTTGYKSFRRTLHNRFGSDKQQLFSFVEHFLATTVACVIRTEHLSIATEMFLTINANTVQLTPADLAKAALLMRLAKSSAEEAEIESSWRRATDYLEGNKKAQMSFFRDVILSKVPKRSLSEKSVFDAIGDIHIQAKLGNDTKAFVETLDTSLNVMDKFLNYRDVEGHYTFELEDLSLHNSEKILSSALLAGDKLKPQEFRSYVRLLDDVLLVHSCLGSTMQKRKDAVSDIRVALLHSLDAQEAYADFEAHQRAELSVYKSNLITAFNSFNFALQAAAKTMRLILARIYNLVESQERPGTAETVASLHRSYQVEHILPRNGNPAEFGMSEAEYKGQIEKLGNLVLLQATSNNAASNKGFAEKRAYYAASPHVLTQSLAWTPKTPIIRSPLSDRISKTGLSDVWDSARINMRQQLYLELFLKSIKL